jgi:hypothetical protein
VAVLKHIRVGLSDELERQCSFKTLDFAAKFQLKKSQREINSQLFWQVAKNLHFYI